MPNVSPCPDFTERRLQVIPAEQVDILPPSSKCRQVVGNDEPDATLKRYRHSPTITEWQFILSDNWRKVIRYAIVGLVVAAVLWKIMPAVQSAVPLLTRAAG